MNRPVHFEIHAADPEGLIKFYGEVFGWTFPVWMETPVKYWGVVTGPRMDEPGFADNIGINGGLMKRMRQAPGQNIEGHKGHPVNAFVVTVQVVDYDATHTKIMNAGGIVALPKAAIPGMAWQGYYQDPDGNIFGLHQADKDAQ